MTTICEIQHASKTYGSGATLVYALKDCDFSLASGEFTALSGPSGSGKTTMLNLVGLLDVPSAGTVKVEGTDVSGLANRELAAIRAKRIGFVFQSFNLIPVLTALENVELALQLAHVGGSRRERSVAALEQVGLGDKLDRRPNQLSGGQQQRVAIARALVKEPALIIADEPTANLDSNTGSEILALMRKMNADHGTTFLFSTHDPMVMKMARRLVTLHDGQVVSDEMAA
jgi:putative ABC transport system ATP-binding protein